MANEIIKKAKQQRWNILVFFFVFVGLAAYLIARGSMTDASGDATDIWKTITTYGSDHVYGSYVLYKGMFALYPYIVLYRLAMFFGTNPYLFIMLLRAALFAYLCAVGLPYTIAHLTGKPAKAWQRLLFAVILFYFWRNTFILAQLMVDFPRIILLVLATNAVLKLGKESSTPRWIKYSLAGLLVGCCFCLAGTMTLAGVCLMIYAIVVTLPRKVLKDKAARGVSLLLVALFLICGMAMPQLDNQFRRHFADPLREQGYWIPTKDDILSLTLTQFMDKYGYFPTVNSPRGYAVLAEERGIDAAEQASNITGAWLTPREYLSIVAKHPVDIATIWANRLFLMLSMDYKQVNTLSLALSYTLLYIAIVSALKKCRKLKDVFNRKFWICLAFLMAVAGSVVSIVEMRMGAPLQIFVISVALLGDTLWEGLAAFKNTVKGLFQSRSLLSVPKLRISWAFILWPVFVLACFSHISMLYELMAADIVRDPEWLHYILFK